MEEPQEEWCSFLIIGCVLMFAKFLEAAVIWRNRNNPVIKVRGVWNSLYLDLILVLILLLAIIATAGNIPCGVYFALSMFLFCLAIGFLIDRMVLLYAKFFITNEAQILVSQEFTRQGVPPPRRQEKIAEHVRGTSGIAKWVFQHKNWIEDSPCSPMKLAPVVGSIVVCTFICIVYFSLLSRDHSAPFFSLECQADLDRGLGFVSGISIAVLLCLLSTWYVGRHVKENFHLRAEVICLWLWMAESAVFYNMLGKVPRFRGSLGSRPALVIYGVQMQIHLYMLSMIPGAIMLYAVYKTSIRPKSRRSSFDIVAPNAEPKYDKTLKSAQNFHLRAEVICLWLWMAESAVFYNMLGKVPRFRGSLGSRPALVIYGVQMQIHLYMLSMIPGAIMLYAVYKTSIRPKSRRSSFDIVAPNAEPKYDKTLKSAQSLHNKLDIILKDHVLHGAFHQFLCMEFAVENLLFIDQVDALVKACEPFSTDEKKDIAASNLDPSSPLGAEETEEDSGVLTWEMLLKVYALFCDVDSKLSVNISYEMRQSLQQMFVAGKGLSVLELRGDSSLLNTVMPSEDEIRSIEVRSASVEQVSPSKIASGLSLLVSARAEILDLMAKDSLRRFLHSPIFLELNKATS
eukprot:TRINITY_DN18013_c0_g1_i1.p1 TRINITY_DN18013_c0_g1~~TRINITY_DN18013_c0_g1_i1.p1  ORF type:complete len:627 (+),score=130.21 TRINITY_DN18013_c0_g1_i1:47-1927(+)